VYNVNKRVEGVVKGQFAQVGLGPECEAGEGIDRNIEWVLKIKGNA